MVRGVHRPQAIVLLHSHVSSENLWSLHESTMNDAILDSVPHTKVKISFALDLQDEGEETKSKG